MLPDHKHYSKDITWNSSPSSLKWFRKVVSSVQNLKVQVFFTNSPCNGNERREASGRYCDAECIRVACALFACVQEGNRGHDLCERERERERDDGSAPGNKHRGDDLWERETMVWQLEISVGVTIMWDRERERMVWHLEISIEVTILSERERYDVLTPGNMHRGDDVCVRERRWLDTWKWASRWLSLRERERDDDGLTPQNKRIYWHVIIDDGTSVWYSQHTRGDVGYLHKFPLFIHAIVFLILAASSFFMGTSINNYANFVVSLNELKCRNFNEFVNVTIFWFWNSLDLFRVYGFKWTSYPCNGVMV